MTPYTSYAPFYDGTGQIRFAVLFAQYLRELLAQHPPPGQRALDLACGTGTLASLLLDDGWHVTGVDRSAAMLALAAQKCGPDVMLVEADLRDLSLLPAASFDLATCTYDSLNYLLTEAELAACFHGVARALTPSGVWCFDMNTLHFLAHDWPACEVDERPGFMQIQRSQYHDATTTSQMRLIGFVGNDEHGYQRFEETHTERAYEVEVVARLLAAAGFTIEACYECFTFQAPGPQAQRIAWVARR